MDQKKGEDQDKEQNEVKESNIIVENIESEDDVLKNSVKNSVKSQNSNNDLEDKFKNLEIKLENNEKRENENSINITKVKDVPKINEIIEKNPGIVNSYDLNEDTLKNLRDIGKLFFFLNKNTKSS